MSGTRCTAIHGTVDVITLIMVLKGIPPPVEDTGPLTKSATGSQLRILACVLQDSLFTCHFVHILSFSVR